ncbi:hypothetical protein TB2_027781 [Malus domestica]
MALQFPIPKLSLEETRSITLYPGATKNTTEILDATTGAYFSMDGNLVSYEPNRGGGSVSPAESNHSARNLGPVNCIRLGGMLKVF